MRYELNLPNLEEMIVNRHYFEREMADYISQDEHLNEMLMVKLGNKLYFYTPIPPAVYSERICIDFEKKKIYLTRESNEDYLFDEIVRFISKFLVDMHPLKIAFLTSQRSRNDHLKK